jgi:hypothetical protein
MDIPIAHIVGTAALIGLVISATLAYKTILGYVEAIILQAQLRQIAEYVSMNIVNLISLAEFAYGNASTLTVMIKVLKLPTDLAGEAYLVKLVCEDGDYYVQVELAMRSGLSTRLPINLSSTGTHVIFVTEEVQLPDHNIKPSSVVYGGNPNAVVWCWKNGSDSMCVGVGVWMGGV